MTHDANEIDGEIDGSDDDALRAQRHATHHRAEIEESHRCGCFACGKTFRPTAIVAWISNGGAPARDTARCPECNLDAVLGSASGLPLTPAFLRRLRRHWYRR